MATPIAPVAGNQFYTHVANAAAQLPELSVAELGVSAATFGSLNVDDLTNVSNITGDDLTITSVAGDVDIMVIHTAQFRRRHRRRWSVITSSLLTSLGRKEIPASWDRGNEGICAHDDEIKYRHCKSVCRDIYGYKEHKWLSKHTFMILSPLIYPGIKTKDDQRTLRLPSVVLRQIFVCLHGHGP